MSNDLKRLYNGGRVGMIVVLDYVHLSDDDPFAKYTQPAFFTIVEDLTPEPRSQGVYVLRDSTGNLIKTQQGDDPGASSMSSYLSEVSVWQKWSAANASSAIASRDRQIHDLSVRVTVLKEVMSSQGVRVISTEQAQTLGIKP